MHFNVSSVILKENNRNYGERERERERERQRQRETERDRGVEITDFSLRF